MNINFFDSVWTEISTFRSLIELNMNILDTNLFNILACLIWALISLSKVVKKPGPDLKRNKEFREEFLKNTIEAQEERRKAKSSSGLLYDSTTIDGYVTENLLMKRNEKLWDEGLIKVLEIGKKRLLDIYREGGINI
jgi:hypothetical protein